MDYDLRVRVSEYKLLLEKLKDYQLEEVYEKNQSQIEKIGNGPIKEVISEYQAYLTVDSAIREKYEQILKEYNLAKEILNFYKKVDPKLHDLYDWGLCDYFYMGSPEDIKNSELKVEEIKLELEKYEKEYPNLLLKKQESIIVPSTISSVYTNLLIRKTLIEHEIKRRKQKYTR